MAPAGFTDSTAGGLPAGSALPRGRFAPSPTGLLHVGSARTALAAWLSIRQRGGTFVWRVEDLDPPRTIEGTEEEAMRDLGWLGLDWDEGPDVGGPHAPYRQSERGDLYDAALDRLAASGDVFPCTVSRKDLLELASAPHGRGGLPPYPAELRPNRLAPGWLGRQRQRGDAAVRFMVRQGPVRFDDRVMGPRSEDVGETVGDFVLKRRDGLFAYQLAVVVDDLAMGITEVTRGQDLLDSTGRQIQLIEALGGVPPRYAHLPLVINAAGEKLSKRDEGLTLAALRDEGVSPGALCGYLGFSLGLNKASELLTPLALIERFAWDRVPPGPWALPDDLARQLRHLA
jgi:glutamyl-tRNA synthetase